MKTASLRLFFSFYLCMQFAIVGWGGVDLPGSATANSNEAVVDDAKPEPLISPSLGWRNAANGGINVLYCYLGVNKVRLDYKQLREQRFREFGTNTDTALTLARLATEQGLPLRPFSLTMQELRSCAKPVIVHMDGETPEAGAFLLVFDVVKDKVYYVNGPSVSVHVISVEDFRRAWSGVALLPSTSGKKQAVFSLAGLALGFIFVLLRPTTKPKMPAKPKESYDKQETDPISRIV
jgi:hypothetical protein